MKSYRKDKKGNIYPSKDIDSATHACIDTIDKIGVSYGNAAQTVILAMYGYIDAHWISLYNHHYAEQSHANQKDFLAMLIIELINNEPELKRDKHLFIRNEMISSAGLVGKDYDKASYLELLKLLMENGVKFNERDLTCISDKKNAGGNAISSEELSDTQSSSTSPSRRGSLGGAISSCVGGERWRSNG